MGPVLYEKKKKYRCYLYKVEGERVPFSNGMGQKAVLILFVVGLELYEGKVLGSCAATGKFAIVRYDHW